jgi:DNA-binding transcriptional LysR family regulator
LHRTTRRVSLTQDGMVYYERAKDLLANLDELDGMFQHDPSSISGRLRVDMPVGVARNLVIPKLPAFCSSIRALNWSSAAAIVWWM